MQTQSDTSERVVSLANLRAMCKHASGTAHRYTVVKVSRSRVHVEYSNPNEYGTDYPMLAVFPCYPSTWPGDEDNPRVVLSIHRVIGDNWGGEGWQAFYPVVDGPKMFRGDGDSWESEREVYVRLTDASITTAWDKAGCMVLGWIVETPDHDPMLVPANDDAVIAALKPLVDAKRGR